MAARDAGGGMVLGFGIGLIFGPAFGTLAPFALILGAGIGLVVDAAIADLTSGQRSTSA